MITSPVLFRGERDGSLRVEGGLNRPWFFTERHDHAMLYSGTAQRRHRPLACVFVSSSPLKVLDLTQLNVFNPDHNRLIETLTAEFADEGWIDRYSGEDLDAWSYIEGGNLYDYESSGSGERWNAMFRIALDDMGFDAVRVLDRTDGTRGEASIVWVTHRLDIIEDATPGQELAALLKHPESQVPRAAIDAWLKASHPDLIERIHRLTHINEAYRLDQLNLESCQDIHQDIWCSMAHGTNIRPGDFVTLDFNSAKKQGVTKKGTEFIDVMKLDRVLNTDIYWTTNDPNGFFYLPEKWRRCSDITIDQYLASLSPEQIEILCDGEMQSIEQHKDEIIELQKTIIRIHNPAASSHFHGPEHWDRVRTHAMATSRACGIKPLIPHIFALVHDSQRENDSFDPEHGWRATQWIQSNRSTLFRFLEDEEVDLLTIACKTHSDGCVEGPLHVQACWDADRLDLWHCDIEPMPQHLCGDYAKKPDVIRAAMRLTGNSMDDGLNYFEDQYSAR